MEDRAIKTLMTTFTILFILSLASTVIGCEGEQEISTLTPTSTPKILTQVLLKAELSEIRMSGESIASLIQTIRSRLDDYGATGAVVESQNIDQVLVQLPDVEDIDMVIKLISQTGQLDIRELSPESWQFVEQQIDQGLQPDYETLTEERSIEWIAAIAIDNNREEIPLTGIYVASSQWFWSEITKEAKVMCHLDNTGSYLLKQITGRLIGRPLGIFLDNQCISISTIRSKFGSRLAITALSPEYAQAMSIILNSGVLTVPVKVVNLHEIP